MEDTQNILNFTYAYINDALFLTGIGGLLFASFIFACILGGSSNGK